MNKSEYIKKMFEDGFINGSTQITKTNIAITLGHIYKNEVFPCSMTTIITHLKNIVKVGESSNLQSSLSAITSLAFC